MKPDVPMKDPGVKPAAFATGSTLTCNANAGIMRLTFVEEIVGGVIPVHSIVMPVDQALSMANAIQEAYKRYMPQRAKQELS